jgi:hypothetical protein
MMMWNLQAANTMTYRPLQSPCVDTLTRITVRMLHSEFEEFYFCQIALKMKMTRSVRAACVTSPRRKANTLFM